MIAHRLSTVRKADVIVVFKEGKVVEIGDHQSLMTIEDGIYQTMYALQINSKQKR